jgi:hypothetical protein
MPTTSRLAPSYGEGVNSRRGLPAAGEVVAALRSLQTRSADPQRAYRKALAKHHQRVGQLRTAVFAGVVACVATVTAALVGAQYWWLVATAGAVWLGGGAFVRLRRLTLPTPPPPPCAMRLIRVQESLLQLIPAVEHLHPSAGKELRGAVERAAPLLDQQAQRLALLDALRTTMAGTDAGMAAGTAAGEVELRLERGVDAYERLLAASATLLGAPDLGRSADSVLTPAIAGMQAYSAGLTAASD